MSGKSDDEGTRPRWNPEWNAELENYKERLVTRARFKGTYKGSPDLLSLVEAAEGYVEAFSVEEWNDTAESYPNSALVKGQLTKRPYEDCPARAYHLTKAMDRLLVLVGAPEAMRSDMGLLLSAYTPRGAVKSAKVQDAMISNVAAPITEVAEKTDVGRTTVHDLIDKRIVIRPTR